MKKNVGSQLIAVQLVSATDGSDVTSGTTTVAVELDGAAGTGGTATHIANGKWEYAPIQADTNADHITYQFTNSTAVSVLLNVYTTFPQTVDNDVLASGSTGFEAIDTVVDAILVDTADLQANQGNWLTATGFSTHTAANVRTEMDSNSTQLTAIVADTGELQTNQSNWLTATGFATSVELATHDGKLDTLTTTVGTAGDGLTDITLNAASIDLVWDETMAGHITADTAGLVMNEWQEAGRLDAILDSILAMLDDARTEPGQGAPPVNPDAMTKIDYLYKAWRNRKTQTASVVSLYADDATTVDQKSAISDNGTTADVGEMATGP